MRRILTSLLAFFRAVRKNAYKFYKGEAFSWQPLTGGIFFKKKPGDSPDSSSSVQSDEVVVNNIGRLKGESVRDVMIPRAQIRAISEDALSDKAVDWGLIQFMSEANHYHLAVYRGDLDHIIGSVCVFELVKKDRRKEWTPSLSSVSFVAPSMRAFDLFVDLRLTGTPMAVVVDEHGGTDGLVITNSLIESIIKGIAGEDERGLTMPKAYADGSLLADACLPIEAVEQHFGISFDGYEDEEVDTLGGLATTLAGRVPRQGEITHHASGIAIEVVDADSRRVHKVRVHFPPSKSGLMNVSSGS